jgi:hypothetical protein
MEGELVVDRLETRLRVVEWALGVLVLLVIVLAAMLWNRSPRQEALVAQESFRLVDAEGRLRVSINADAEGTRLRLYDAKEERRLSLAVDEAGSPGIALFDPAGNLRAEFAVIEKGAELALLDENGKKLFSRP